MMTETNVKLLELLKEAIPSLTRVAVIFDPATPSHGPGLKAVEAAGPSLGLQVLPMAVRSAAEYDVAFTAMTREGAEAVLVLSTPVYTAGARQLSELAIVHKLPSMFGPSEHARAGGFMSFGPDRADLWRRGANYVDQVLKGAKPADLPVQQPIKFELVINLRTAKALGLTISESFLLRADRVIE
jgi:putative ABC transport system substrate-binding protein